jgi:hypothetical protein
VYVGRIPPNSRESDLLRLFRARNIPVKEADLTQLRVAEDWKSYCVRVPSNMFQQVLNSDWPRDYVVRPFRGSVATGSGRPGPHSRGPRTLRCSHQPRYNDKSRYTGENARSARGDSSRDTASLASTPSLPPGLGSFPTPNGGTICLKVTAYNCNGFKSAHPFITSSVQEDCDIMFLSEHWLRPHEILAPQSSGPTQPR